MNAIWSFWTKPFKSHYKNIWLSEEHHLLSWILSVCTARQHYKRSILYTDRAGADILCSALQLPFNEVHIVFDDLEDENGEWWVLGKLYAYQMQREPFLHIDSDVYLWNALPERVISGAVFGQNTEFLDEHDMWYKPREFETFLKEEGGWLPREWAWYTSNRGREAVCCGIFGGHRLDFICRYAEVAARIAQSCNDNVLLRCRKDGVCSNILVEQYFLAACLHYHSADAATMSDPLRPSYLFSSEEAAFHGPEARKYGYTHLIAGAKKSGFLMRRLESRVQRDYHEFYKRVARYKSI